MEMRASELVVIKCNLEIEWLPDSEYIRNIYLVFPNGDRWRPDDDDYLFDHVLEYIRLYKEK